MTQHADQRSLQDQTPGETSVPLPWTRVDAACLLLLCAGALLAIARFWQTGIASDADMLMAIHRVLNLEQALRSGIVFPRLDPNINFTYGGPLFQYYPPLASYLALGFRGAGLGFVEAVKALFTLNLLLAGAGAYVYARWLFGNRLAALVSGMAFLLAPYLLVNIYERGALSESLAWALTPWLFLAFHQVLAAPGRSRNWSLVAGSLAALLVLAHNVTALFVLPAVTLYVLVLAWHERRLRRMLAVAGALALGLGLSAFYWLPALGEMRFAVVETSMLKPALSPAAHLVSLGNLVQHSLVVDYWGEARFRMALWQMLLGGAGVLLLRRQPARLRWPLALLAATWLLILAVQLTVSRPLWEALPLVRFIQFPWRLMGLASFCVAMLFGSVFAAPPPRRSPSRPGTDDVGVVRAVAATGLLALILFLSTRTLTPALSPIWKPITSADITVPNLFERARAYDYALFSDYRPPWVQVKSTSLARPRPSDAPASPPLPARPSLQVISESATQQTFQVQTDAPFALRIHRIFFPGWRAYVDGQPVEAGPSGPIGLVTAEAPAGTHTVAFKFQSTPMRRAATAISLLSAVVMVVLLATSRRGRIALVVMLGVAVAIGVAVLVWSQSSGEDTRRPVAVAASFSPPGEAPAAGELRLLGFHLPSQVWQPGDTLPLRLYWFAPQAPSNDYRVFLHLIPQDDSGKVAQTDSDPVLGFSPTTRWEPGEVIVDLQELSLASSTPPGTYRLIVGLYRPGAPAPQNLAVSDAPTALPGDRVLLGQVEIGSQQ